MGTLVSSVTREIAIWNEIAPSVKVFSYIASKNGKKIGNTVYNVQKSAGWQRSYK